MPFAATWMDLEMIILSEVSQTEKNKYNITYLWNLKNMLQVNLFTKQKQTHRCRKQYYGYQTGRSGEGRDKLGVWDEQIHTTIYKTDKQQGPTV